MVANVVKQLVILSLVLGSLPALARQTIILGFDSSEAILSSIKWNGKGGASCEGIIFVAGTAPESSSTYEAIFIAANFSGDSAFIKELNLSRKTDLFGDFYLETTWFEDVASMGRSADDCWADRLTVSGTNGSPRIALSSVGLLGIPTAKVRTENLFSLYDDVENVFLVMKQLVMGSQGRSSGAPRDQGLSGSWRQQSDRMMNRSWEEWRKLPTYQEDFYDYLDRK